MSEYENERLAKTEERLKSDSRRLDRLERLADEVHIQNENIARLVVQPEFVGRQLSSHEKRLANIESLPGRGIRMLVGDYRPCFRCYRRACRFVILIFREESF